jgi:hypothetical protein
LAQAVGRKKFLRCARCKAAWYCSAHCQRTHWRDGHSRACAEEAAAASGAGERAEAGRAEEEASVAEEAAAAAAEEAEEPAPSAALAAMQVSDAPLVDLDELD